MVTLCHVLRSRLESVGAEAGALVHTATGVCLEAIPAPTDTDLTTLPIAGDALATARLAQQILRLTGTAGGSIEEILSATATKYELSQPLQTPDGSDLLLYLRFDSARVATALAHRLLAGFERQIELSHEDQARLKMLAAPIPMAEENPQIVETTVAPSPPVSIPASPAESALRHREQILAEEKEYARMNVESIRWLKEMKQRINWARPFTAGDEPIMG